MKTAVATYLLGLSFQELTALVEDAGEAPFRARQLYEGLYSQRLTNLEDFSTLPKDFRKSLLDKGLEVGSTNIIRRFESRDGTIRYLIELPDGQSVETVWMPDGDGGESGDGSDADP